MKNIKDMIFLMDSYLVLIRSSIKHSVHFPQSYSSESWERIP